jgi:hypothetical protein
MYKHISSAASKLNARGTIGFISKATASLFSAGVAIGLGLLVTKTSPTGHFAVPGLIAGTIIMGSVSAATSHWASQNTNSRHVDKRITAAEGLRDALLDDEGDESVLRAEYNAWRKETERVLPKGWESDFKMAGNAAFAEFDKTIEKDPVFSKRTASPQKALFKNLEWDLYKLRDMKEKIRKNERPKTA